MCGGRAALRRRSPRRSFHARRTSDRARRARRVSRLASVCAGEIFSSAAFPGGFGEPAEDSPSARSRDDTRRSRDAVAAQVPALDLDRSTDRRRLRGTADPSPLLFRFEAIFRLKKIEAARPVRRRTHGVRLAGGRDRLRSTRAHVTHTLGSTDSLTRHVFARVLRSREDDTR